MSIVKEMDEAIAKHFKIPNAIRRQARQAAWDLHYGPTGGGMEDEDGYGNRIYHEFASACSIVSEWCDENLSEVWYDIQSGEVLESEPEGYWEACYVCDGTGEDPDGDDDVGCALCEDGELWVGPSWEDYIHADLPDVKRALFDRELVDHI